MLTYKAMYKFVDGSVHAEVLDFPGAITSGRDLEHAREMLAAALVDMAETSLLRGEPLPTPDAGVSDVEADLEEPIHLLLSATNRVATVPKTGRGDGAVKRKDLPLHLARHGCRFAREGGEHSIWENPANGRRTAVPRHRGIPNFTADRICKQPGIPTP